MILIFLSFFSDNGGGGGDCPPVFNTERYLVMLYNLINKVCADSI